jgi:hypothetical protein
LKIYTNTTFDGIWPVGTAAIIRAENQEEAAKLLNNVLEERQLVQDSPVAAEDMVEFTGDKTCVILLDGDY